MRTETDVKNFPPRADILASLFARANDWELTFQIWISNSLGGPYPGRYRRYGRRLGGNLKIFGRQKRFMFNAIVKATPESPDNILFKRLRYY